jgi:hypothetical protein
MAENGRVHQGKARPVQLKMRNNENQKILQ